MTKFVDNLHKIDCYKMLMGEEYVTLAFYYFYKLNYNYIDVFSDEIKLFEGLIEDYNNSLQEKKERERFVSYILNYDSDYVQNCIIQYDREPWKYSKPVIWKDRNKGDYYIRNLTESHRFELYVACIFKNYGFDIGLYYGKDEQYAGESRAGIEIKYDKESLKTGNIYIEYKERLNSNDVWVKSGILKNDNTTYWAIGNYNFLFFIEKAILVDIMNNKYPNIKSRKVSARRGTSQGYIISIADAQTISAPIKTVIRDIQELN